MIRYISMALLTVATSLSTAFAADAPIVPFHGVYATYRNGAELGRTTLDLAENGDGTWTLKSETTGTSGLAKIAGVHVLETSHFHWRDGRPEAIDYDFVQDSAFKKRVRHAGFDAATHTVSVTEGKGHFTYATAPGLIDRQAVTLALAADLKRGATEFNYKVAVKDRIEDMHYARGTAESIKVPAGTFKAVVMQREGAAATDRTRVGRSWFAESLGWMPVQIEQTESKGDTITLKLVSSNRK